MNGVLPLYYSLDKVLAFFSPKERAEYSLIKLSPLKTVLRKKKGRGTGYSRVYPP